MEIKVEEPQVNEASLTCRGVRDKRALENGVVTFHKVPNDCYVRKELGTKGSW